MSKMKNIILLSLSSALLIFGCSSQEKQSDRPKTETSIKSSNMADYSSEPTPTVPTSLANPMPSTSREVWYIIDEQDYWWDKNKKNVIKASYYIFKANIEPFNISRITGGFNIASQAGNCGKDGFGIALSESSAEFSPKSKLGFNVETEANLDIGVSLKFKGQEILPPSKNTIHIKAFMKQLKSLTLEDLGLKKSLDVQNSEIIFLNLGCSSGGKSVINASITDFHLLK